MRSTERDATLSAKSMAMEPNSRTSGQAQEFGHGIAGKNR